MPIAQKVGKLEEVSSFCEAAGKVEMIKQEKLNF